MNKSKFSYQVRLSTAKSIISGRVTSGSAAAGLGCNKSIVKHWVRLYEALGSKGLKLPSRTYDSRFKLKVVRHVLQNRLSLIKAAILFEIPYPTLVGAWVRRYKVQGEQGFCIKESSLLTGKTMSKNPKKPESDSLDPMAKKLKEMEGELAYLRAENAFLKKLDALIKKEEAVKERKKR